MRSRVDIFCNKFLVDTPTIKRSKFKRNMLKLSSASRPSHRRRSITQSLSAIKTVYELYEWKMLKLEIAYSLQGKNNIRLQIQHEAY